MATEWWVMKSEPAVDDKHVAIRCTKCGGTGLYVQSIVNGLPQSNTGLTCYPCNGTGWHVNLKRRDWTQDTATPKQRAYLKSLGIIATPSLTKSEATNTIKVALENKR